MAIDGWIKLYRKITDNPIWLCEPFTRGQAWVDMLLLANHDKSIFYKRGNKITVERGQLGRSEVELSDRWRWSRTKVRKFLNDLEKEQQIIQQKSTITLIVTILNYDIYQEKEQQIGQQKDSRKTAEEQQKNTYKNEKNINNENNEKKFNFKQSLIVLGVSEKIISDWLAVRKLKKAVNTETAFSEIENQIKISGLTANECIKIASENSWSGFKAKWLENTDNINGKKQLSSQIDLSKMNYTLKP